MFYAVPRRIITLEDKDSDKVAMYENDDEHCT